jgi:hypothetical protein
MFNDEVMSAAAERGYTHICQYLHTEDCAWSTDACECAAHGGHLPTLRWLHEQGYPWDAQVVRLAAAKRDHLPILKYMADVEPAATAAQLVELLAAAGALRGLGVAKWLRQEGAEWPAELRYLSYLWKGTVLQWAGGEGCTSPV